MYEYEQIIVCTVLYVTGLVLLLCRAICLQQVPEVEAGQSNGVASPRTLPRSGESDQEDLPKLLCESNNMPNPKYTLHSAL